MRKAENFYRNIEEIEKILPLQKYPHEAIEYLKYIAGDVEENGIAWIFIRAYCLGIIQGKRIERLRRRR